MAKAPEATKGELRKSFATQITALMTTAFGLVAALAWNGAIQTLFTDVFGTQKTIVPLFAYAIAVTLIAVVVIFYLSRVMAKFTK